VGHEGPGDTEDARVIRKRPGGELGQLAVVAQRQITANIPYLPLDHVKIVDQPLGRRGDGGSRRDGLRDIPVGRDKHRFVLRKPRRQRGVTALARCDRLGRS
jgi:hypothetical protein